MSARLRGATRAWRADPRRRRRILVPAGIILFAWLGGGPCAPGLAAQTRLDWDPRMDGDPWAQLAEDRGVSGLAPRLQALRTTASLLHTVAHPDDEHAGVLTLLARGHGVRTSLLSLSRGEGGANAIGPELFDALGVIRTEELLLAGRYYGLAALYFTTAVDYGFSKTLEEAERSWDRERVLEDMVRVIRIERPLVVVSRWHGSARDGHGHHQASGVLTPEAVRAAADPTRFPEQLRSEGLRPWRVRRLYRGGIREGEPAQVEIETTRYAPWLGTTFQDFAAYGLSLQRSQTAGRIRRSSGPVIHRYEQLGGPASPQAAPPGQLPFFAGLDTSLPGLFALMEEPEEPAARAALEAADRAIERAITDLRPLSPQGILPHLIEALGHVERAHGKAANGTESRRLLERTMAGLHDALRMAAGVTLRATLNGGGGPPVVSPRIVAGQTFDVVVEPGVADPAVSLVELHLAAPAGWSVRNETDVATELRARTPRRFRVSVPEAAAPDRPYFLRASIRESQYAVTDSTALHRPWTPPRLFAVAVLRADGRTFTVRTPVRADVPDPPRGVRREELRVVPALSVRVDPSVSVVMREAAGGQLPIDVELVRAAGGGGTGEIVLRAPPGWSVTPAARPFELSAEGTATASFRVVPAPSAKGAHELAAVATFGGRAFAESTQLVRHPDLAERTVLAPARATVRILDASVVPDLRVAYLMGVGDEVPAAIEALGGRVDPVTVSDLRASALGAYDAVVLGTRAYAVHPELRSVNDRLLSYVEGGGHLVVLYQTPEFDPSSLAPYPAVLPTRPEEVSEEDAPVAILAPDDPLLSWPNRITEADFDGWVEQRGSKFFSEWGSAFVPLVETHDRGQAPQRGVWLSAPYGAGHYSYVALALHRQTPYAIPGAYRILANLVSRARAP